MATNKGLIQDLAVLEKNMRAFYIAEGEEFLLVLTECAECRNMEWSGSKDNLGKAPASHDCHRCGTEYAKFRVDDRVLHVALHEAGSKMRIEREP